MRSGWSIEVQRSVGIKGWGQKSKGPRLGGKHEPSIEALIIRIGFGGPLITTLTHQNLLFCNVLIKSILGFKIRTYKKVGYGSLGYNNIIRNPQNSVGNY